MNPTHKFKFVRNGELSEPYTLEQLITSKAVLQPNETAIQAIGIPDANGRDLYEGDVLILDVQTAKQKPRNKHVAFLLCYIHADKTYLDCRCETHFVRDDGRIVHTVHTATSKFLRNLIDNGAVWMGNTVVTPKLNIHYKPKAKRMAVHIDWDTDGDLNILAALPKEMEIPDGMTDEDEISDWISEEAGFCQYGFHLICTPAENTQINKEILP